MYRVCWEGRFFECRTVLIAADKENSLMIRHSAEGPGSDVHSPSDE